jgi:hypothetical protein
MDPNKKQGTCACCNKNPKSQKFTSVSFCDECLSFYGLQGISVPIRNNLSGINKGNQTNYYSMLKGLSVAPAVSLQMIKGLFGQAINDLVADYPVLGERSLVDTLTAADLNLIKEKYPQVLQARGQVLNILHILNNNFKAFLEDKLNEGLNLAEAQVAGIKEFLSLPEYQALNFSEIYTQGEVSQEQVNRIVNALQVATTLIPDKYKNNTPVPTLIIKGLGEAGPSFASAAQKSLIVLNVQKNLIAQVAEAMHEYLHLIEQFNPDINLATNKFLLTQASSLTYQPQKVLGSKYQKPFQPSAGDVLVVPGPFVDTYVGRTYGPLDSTLTKLVTTEVLSMGGELLLLSPTNFSLRDPAHFHLITQFLQGKI